MLLTCQSMQRIQMSPAAATAGSSSTSPAVEGAVPWTNNPVSTTLSPHYYNVPAVGRQAIPSQPNAAADDNEANVCVICLDSPSTVGLTHKESTHLCLCLECSKMFKTGDKCPKCRAKIDIITRVF